MTCLSAAQFVPTLPMLIERRSESMILVRELDAPAYVVAEVARRSPRFGLVDAVAANVCLGLYFESHSPEDSQVADWIENLALDNVSPVRHEIPVCYALGPDIESTAQQLSLSAKELITLHSSVDYVCDAIGFSPGFPYLGPLPDRLQGLGRRSSPRVRVEPGSVGIVGQQSCIYPSATPGGWWLIGLTPLRIVDPEANHFPIQAGDVIRFRAIEETEFAALKGNLLESEDRR